MPQIPRPPMERLSRLSSSRGHSSIRKIRRTPMCRVPDSYSGRSVGAVCQPISPATSSTLSIAARTGMRRPAFVSMNRSKRCRPQRARHQAGSEPIDRNGPRAILFRRFQFALPFRFAPAGLDTLPDDGSDGDDHDELCLRIRSCDDATAVGWRRVASGRRGRLLFGQRDFRTSR